MTFNYQIFDVEIERQVDPSRLTWPTPEEDQEDSSFFGLLVGNQLYCDLRDISWAVARHVIEIEERCVKHIEESAKPSEIGSFVVADAAEFLWDWDLENLWDEIGAVVTLDVGVASTVAALSATGCTPFTSCSAGAFGGWHPEDYPLVAFYARPEAVPLLMKCAEKAGVGLENMTGHVERDHPLMVYADDIRKMRDFANVLSEQSANFRRIRPRKSAKPEEQAGPKQMRLNL